MTPHRAATVQEEGCRADDDQEKMIPERGPVQWIVGILAELGDQERPPVRRSFEVCAAERGVQQLGLFLAQLLEINRGRRFLGSRERFDVGRGGGRGPLGGVAVVGVDSCRR